MTGFRECWYVIERGVGKSEEFLSPPPEGPHSWVKRRSHAMVWRTYKDAKDYLDAHQGPGVLVGARLGYIDPAMAVNVQGPLKPSQDAHQSVVPTVATPSATSPVVPPSKQQSRRRTRPKKKLKRKAAASKKPPRAKTAVGRRRKVK